jgi:hypothetical protein
MPDDFQIAYERARARIGYEEWETLSPTQRNDEIYKEMRALDAERIASRCPSVSGGKSG